MILVALDCDGTLDLNGGPIPVSKLYEINVPPYIQIVVVSESAFCTQLPFPRFVNDTIRPRHVTRLENLLAASLRYPSLLNMYISDNIGDNDIAKNAGFIYCHPNDFNTPLKF